MKKFSMRYKWIAAAAIIAMGIFAFFSDKLFSNTGKEKVAGSLYDFRMKSLDGELIDFGQFRGKHVLIVNTASKCGYTPQYKDLQSLHERFGDKVAILGFPANNFLWQEPGSNDEIAEFCQKNYGVTFQMFEKVSVKGRDRHPLYEWLAVKSGKKPGWNFSKYLIDPKGEVVGFYGPKVSPLDEAIVKKLAP